MVVAQGQKNPLHANYVLLQGHIKRDPASYKDEFTQQYVHYKASVQMFKLQPTSDPSSLVHMIGFLSQVIHCYPESAPDFIDSVIELLKSHGGSFNADLRMGLWKSLVLMRNKKLASPNRVLELAFDLFTCQDKELRKYMFASTVNHVKNVCLRDRDLALNTVGDQNLKVARIALLMCVDLFRRNVWSDAKCANIIASACLNRSIKMVVTALKFFLGNENADENQESESDSEDEANKTVKEVMLAYRVGKKSKKRKKTMERAKTAVLKEKRKKKAKVHGSKALYLIYDPQTFTERLLKRLESSNDRFEYKLLMMAAISRLIGIHELLLLNYYNHIQKYLKPHQREVTRILLYTAQASNAFVPPDIIESVVKCIVNNFVTERNSSEVITVGLNAVREIASNCPLAVTEDLMSDLADYRTYKNKNVMMAARSLIQLYRTVNPNLLRKKDRGKPTEHTQELTAPEYGASTAKAFLPGAEVLLQDQQAKASQHEDDGSSDSEWESEEEEPQPQPSTSAPSTAQLVAARNSVAETISSDRILTQEDHERIRSRQIAKKLNPATSRKRRREEELQLLEDEEEERTGLTRLADIEHLHKRPKTKKEERLEAINSGKEGREAFGRPKKNGPHVGRTNREMAKRKAFTMVKHKQRGKKKRSFQEKQASLRKSLLSDQKRRR